MRWIQILWTSAIKLPVTACMTACEGLDCGNQCGPQQVHYSCSQERAARGLRCQHHPPFWAILTPKPDTPPTYTAWLMNSVHPSPLIQTSCYRSSVHPAASSWSDSGTTWLSADQDVKLDISQPNQSHSSLTALTCMIITGLIDW